LINRPQNMAKEVQKTIEKLKYEIAEIGDSLGCPAREELQGILNGLQGKPIGVRQMKNEALRRCSSPGGYLVQSGVAHGWRVVLYHCLMACVEIAVVSPRPTSRAQFTTSMGLPRATSRTGKSNAIRQASASQQVPLPETYKLIEESPTASLRGRED